MNKSTKILASTTIAFALLATVLGTQLFSNYSAFKVGDKSLVNERFDVEIRRASGELVLSMPFSNLITDIGKKHARNLFSTLNSSDPGPTIIDSNNRTVALSLSDDDEPLVSWTQLATEYTAFGLDRKGVGAVGVTILNATAYSTDFTWTCSADGKQVQCAGVHWYDLDGSDGNLYACGTFTPTTLNTDDTIKITYTLNFG